MKGFTACIAAVFVGVFVARAAMAADMESYRKHIAKFDQLMDKAQELKSKGDSNGADKTMAKALEEKALADVALNRAPGMPRINEPGAVVYYDRPYYGYGYWGRPWGPWWGYPYHRW